MQLCCAVGNVPYVTNWERLGLFLRCDNAIASRLPKVLQFVELLRCTALYRNDPVLARSAVQGPRSRII